MQLLFEPMNASDLPSVCCYCGAHLLFLLRYLCRDLTEGIDFADLPCRLAMMARERFPAIHVEE